MAGAGANATNVQWAGTDCFKACADLFNAINKMATTGTRVRVSYDNYQVEYKPEDMKAVIGLYNTYRAQCPQAQQQLPNLQPGMRVQRGGPIYGVVRR